MKTFVKSEDILFDTDAMSTVNLFIIGNSTNLRVTELM